MTIKFLGATETVTGSKHLLITKKGKQILLDCGLYQNKGSDNETLNRHLGLNPAELEAVILSHAHIDHSGNLPYLVKNGFNGKIYCTPATFDVCEILLEDSAHIHENDIQFINKRRKQKGLDPIKPLYTTKDAERCLKHFKPIPYHADFHINDELQFKFTDAGHILGSAVVNILAVEEGKTTRLCFTGDIGRSTDMLLKAPEKFPQADYIICESTYGDRLHEDVKNAEIELLEVVTKTCVEKKGKLIIPAFSLGRTQEIVYTLDRMKNAGLLPDIKVFVDSPLSTNATDIMRKHLSCLNAQVQEYLKTDDDPFGFNNLEYIKEATVSMELNNYKQPCIIISASGMMEAGRIKHHLRNSISNKKNTVLVVGYCPPDSLGGRLLRGEKEVKIFGELHKVEADIELIASYSAHADYNEMLDFLSCQNKDAVKSIFLVHGEKEAKRAWQEHLKEAGYRQVQIPEKGQQVELI